MFGLEPEAIIKGLLVKYGITPEHVQMTMQTIERINRAVGEIDPFKTSSGQVVQHFNKRLTDLDTRLADIEATLQVIVARLPSKQETP